MRTRPIGITIAAVLSFGASLQYSVLAVLAVANRHALVAFLHALSPGGSGPEKIHLAMGRLEVFYYTAMMGLMAVMGLGLWRLRNWTRLVLLAMLAISVAGLTVAGPQLTRSGAAGLWALWGIRMSLCFAWAWYLMRRNVRAAFGVVHECQPA